MPYISERQRKKLDDDDWVVPINPGELNYKITCILKKYIEYNGESYQTYNDIIGVLSCIQMELYRRKISPYEDKKIIENGDVYE
jgi:hypothetical protein